MRWEAIRVCDAVHVWPVAPSTRNVAAVRAAGATAVAFTFDTSFHIDIENSSEWQSNFAY